ncbi:PIG-L deacetylase family protein [Micromonospora echinofusca]|uniref:PIG-L family deacetylase n=1 Tax=Micromonospora echinofusca TaxID=47858 RepID=A0ABS3VQI4_MICEH|nr:PIG-L deacetylase family protein [Micromonospora echinofusca]MBO4206792.1 PIG-L family deacetylase [Micromonospora echinofusca]
MSDRRILILAAHPDDEILGMGGTIARHADRGDAVRICCVTDGSSTQYADDTEILLQKQAEARKAAATLGVTDYVHLDLPDMRLDTLPHVEVNRVVERQVAEFQPDTVYCVQADVNLDHRTVFSSVAVATRPRPGQSVRRVLTYAPTSSTEWTPAPETWWVPNWFVDISATLERKLEAFRHYRSEWREWPHPRNDRALRVHAEHWGTVVGCPAAEPFVLVRGIALP